MNTNSIPNGNGRMPIINIDTSKKYDERVQNVMKSISELDLSNQESATSTQKKVEEELISFEKLMDEECMNRIIATHKLNMILVGKLKEMNYDFTKDKTVNSYENIINNTVNYLNNINK